MTTVFIALGGFPVYFEIHLATTARENVASTNKDPVGANLCIHFSCFCCWSQRQLQRYKLRERKTKERLSGKFCIYKQGILVSGVVLEQTSRFGVVFRDFRKSYYILKLMRGIR